VNCVQTEKTVNDWSEALVQVNAADTVEPRKDLSFDYPAALQKHITLTRALAGDGFL
jgi:hypothetical protein